MFEIYKITNSANGKNYIGLTSFGHKKRWSCHKSYAKRGSMSLLHCAIRKYGAESFEISTVDTTETREDAKAKERHWIKEYKSDDRSLGYNVKEGGELYTLSEETKEKIRQAHKKRFQEHPELIDAVKARFPKGIYKPSQEQTDKMKETKRRQKEAGTLIHTEEHKEKIRQTLLNKSDQIRETSNRIYQENPEVKDKIRESLKKYYAEHPEAKERIRQQVKETNKTREKDPETGRFLKKKPTPHEFRRTRTRRS